MNNHYNKNLKEKARVLRSSSHSKAEKFIWKAALSRGQSGAKFKRQRPIGNYIVDFFSAEVQLVIEIDGSSHQSTGAYDRTRQDWLCSQGIQVLRFSEGEVLNSFSEVHTRLIHAVHALKT